MSQIDFPKSDKMTSVAFGGADYKDLYVTSARTGKPEDALELAGSLFRVRMEVPGFPPIPFPREDLEVMMKNKVQTL